MTPATSIAISVATLSTLRANPMRERRERMYGRAERMSSTGIAVGSASRAGFVLNGVSIVEAGTLGARAPRPRRTQNSPVKPKGASHHSDSGGKLR